MIKGFRVENLRSIKDSKMITLRKINILIGRNSSGKSTVLRFLPLLRQSVEQPTKGPILWFGRLVDFGSFENAARDNDVSRGVRIEFNIIIPKRNQGFRRALHSSFQQFDRGDLFWAPSLNARVSITLGRSTKDRVGNVRKLTMSIKDDRIDIIFGENGIEEIEVMSRPIKLGPGKSWGIFRGKLIPAVSLMQEFHMEDDEGFTHEFFDVSLRPFASEISTALRKIAHGRTSEERITSIANRLNYAPERIFFEKLKNLAGISADLR
ncbi:AAA family ATPase [Xanthomonas campestris]|uniref:AAA family ATPase n=1 Tax=Xanthomonas campestris pv. papavericola TaxID=487881 RepID=A0AAJ2X1S3_XANCA|nr:AAA family ATPase [Xanthomonas campestris]MEC3887625.1 AAA family ATPase [Xanthomonas campestris pv. papavericola]